MGGKNKKIIISLLLFLAISAVIFACPGGTEPGPEDNYVRLIKAKSVRMITDEDGKAYREAVEATFLHNNTKLICDTAYWRVDDNIINAKGNVRLSQDGTELTSQKLDYFVNEDLAQFRGGVVQLRDKDNNTLRTHYLDYNTKDSLAVFSNGASMKDKDGQVIESIDGTYSSKEKLFTFEKNVNMFTDSIFIKTSSMEYHSDVQKAVFSSYIDFWKDDNMLSAGRGWYTRDDETFFFTEDVHATTKDHESWCDTLFFYRNLNNVMMKGRVQLQDSVHHTSAVSRYLFYEDSLSMVTLRHEAAVAMVPDIENAPQDTVYFGADTLVYYSVRYCDIVPSEISSAKTRLSEIMTDPVGEYRKKALEAALAARQEAEKKAAGTRPGLKPVENTELGALPDSSISSKPDTSSFEKKDSTLVGSIDTTMTSIMDSTSFFVRPDSVGVVLSDSSALAYPDTVTVELQDTTKYGFAFATGNVKIFRKDIQVKCDSMRYSDLDSIARFYKEPIIWNDENRQYYSDSLFTLLKNHTMDRASLMSNAMVVTQEDSLLYDQIKGAEIMAYFDSTSALKRFDALGDAVAVFFLEENNKLATVNKVQCKMLSGNFVDGTMDRVYYYDTPKNDAYPVVQFPQGERYLKGFKWTPQDRPVGKSSITTLNVRPSQRTYYESKSRTQFKQTDLYFPGYIKSVYASIEKSKIEAQKRKAKEQEKEVISSPDTLSHISDSLSCESDSLSIVDTLSVKDSLLKDSLAVKDSLGVQKSEKKSFIEKIKDRIERWKKHREERWARLDERDAKREAEKREKELRKKREKTRRELIERQKQERKEQEILNRYIEQYEKQKLKQDGKNSR